MLREFSAFLLLFSFLSLVVHLNKMGWLLGVGAIAVLIVDRLIAHLAKAEAPRENVGSSSIRRRLHPKFRRPWPTQR